jgi:hypothetical protein
MNSDAARDAYRNVMMRGSGRAWDRHHAFEWQEAPGPATLEYLSLPPAMEQFAGRYSTSAGRDGICSGYRPIKSVTDNTYSYARARR